MRKVIAFLLLAGAAAPALAAGSADDRHGWQSHRDSGSQSSQNDNSDRSDRGDRPRFRVERNNDNNDNNARNERPQTEVRVRPQIESNNDNGGGNNGFRGRFNGGEQNVNVNVERANLDRVRAARGDNNDSVRNWHGRVVETNNDRVNVDNGRTNWRGRVIDNPNVAQDRSGDLRRQDRPIPSVFRNRVPVVSDQPREGTQPRLRIDNRRRDTVVNWSTSHWRNDSRYDWQNHRRHHRSLFHLSFYYDPFGWNYRPYQVGWRLWPSYYSSNYWLNDPWQYRLPYAPPGTRWIRYYDDAILVDTWNGEVVDVIYNFFW